MDMLGGKFGLNIVKADAAKRFLDKLAGVSDPGTKTVRSSVTNLFMSLMTKQASSKM